MSINCCDTESYCCDNKCCNTCNAYGNGALGFNNSCLYTLAILLIFGGGGFGPGSFWGNYNNIFRCSGFNTHWCNNRGFNNFNNSNFNTGNYGNNNFN